MKFELEFQQQKGIAIQSSGGLLAFRMSDSKIALASDNCREFLGDRSQEFPLGRNMRDVVGAEIFHALRNVSALPSIQKRREYIGRFSLGENTLDISAFQSGACHVLEMTDIEKDPMPSAYDVLKDVLLFQDRIQSATTEDQIFLGLVTLLRTISGYDHVAACRYRENFSDVIASSGHALSAVETLEVNSQIHIVPSLNQRSVEVHSLADVDQFDMSLSGLRWPPTPSLEKLKAIGASACLTQGVQIRDRLWGYLTFLHRSPRVPNHRTRLTLSHLQPLICAKLNAVQTIAA